MNDKMNEEPKTELRNKNQNSLRQKNPCEVPYLPQSNLQTICTYQLVPSLGSCTLASLSMRILFRSDLDVPSLPPSSTILSPRVKTHLILRFNNQFTASYLGDKAAQTSSHMPQSLQIRWEVFELVILARVRATCIRIFWVYHGNVFQGTRKRLPT